MTDEGNRIAMEVAVGDSVVYSKFAGTEFTEDGEELLILTERGHSGEGRCRLATGRSRQTALHRPE